MPINPDFAPKRQPREDLTADQVRKLLDYDPLTGMFLWRLRGEGKQAGQITKRGYCRIKIGYRHYQAHRLAWLWVHGRWPLKQLDHANQIRSDNRIENLREASRGENQRNRSKTSQNTSGFKGVCWDRSRGKWLATIGINGKLKNLGRFNSAEEAHSAYRNAATLMHGAFARLD